MRLTGTITSNRRGVSVRASLAGNGYLLNMVPDNGGCTIEKINGGPPEVIGFSSEPLSFTAPSYTLILEAMDNGPNVDLKAWVFETGRPIPATPTITGTDTAALTPVLGSGVGALWVSASSFAATHVIFDNASAHDHPVPGDAIGVPAVADQGRIVLAALLLTMGTFVIARRWLSLMASGPNGYR